jgi:hypothetical protein
VSARPDSQEQHIDNFLFQPPAAVGATAQSSHSRAWRVRRCACWHICAF